MNKLWEALQVIINLSCSDFSFTTLYTIVVQRVLNPCCSVSKGYSFCITTHFATG